MILRSISLLLMVMLAVTAYASELTADARKAIEDNRQTDARRLLRAELVQHPDDVYARYNLAVLLERIGHAAEANALYEENLKYGRHLPTLINLSVTYLHAGKRRKAHALLEKAAQDFRSEAVPLYMLADIAEQEGKKGEAAGWYEKAIRMDPLNGFARIRYAAFLQRSGRLSQAQRQAERAVELLPECAACWRRLGEIRMATNHHEEALAALQRSLAIEPTTATRSKMISLLRDMGENDRANRMQQALDAWLKYQAQMK